MGVKTDGKNSIRQKRRLYEALFFMLMFLCLVKSPAFVYAYDNPFSTSDASLTYDSTDTASQDVIDEANKEPKWYEKMFSGIVRVMTGGISQVADVLGISNIDTIIFGRNASGSSTSNFQFGLEDGNIYGTMGAILYATLRNIIFLVFAVQFIYMLVSYQISETSSARADLKGKVTSFIFMFVMLYAVPIFTELVLLVRDTLLKTVFSYANNAVGHKKLSLIYIFANIALDDEKFMSACLWACAAGSTFYLMYNYVNVSIKLTFLFGVFPVVAWRSFSDKNLFQKWTSWFFVQLFIPVLDSVGYLLCIIAYSAVSGTNETAAGMIAMIIFMAIVPCRMMILQLFGAPAAVSRSSIAGLAFMARAFMRSGRDRDRDVSDKGINRTERSNSSANEDSGRREGGASGDGGVNTIRDESAAARSYGNSGYGRDDIVPDDEMPWGFGDAAIHAKDESTGREDGVPLSRLDEQPYDYDDIYGTDDGFGGINKDPQTAANAIAEAEAKVDRVLEESGGVDELYPERNAAPVYESAITDMPGSVPDIEVADAGMHPDSHVPDNASPNETGENFREIITDESFAEHNKTEAEKEDADVEIMHPKSASDGVSVPAAEALKTEATDDKPQQITKEGTKVSMPEITVAAQPSAGGMEGGTAYRHPAQAEVSRTIQTSLGEDAHTEPVSAGAGGRSVQAETSGAGTKEDNTVTRPHMKGDVAGRFAMGALDGPVRPTGEETRSQILREKIQAMGERVSDSGAAKTARAVGHGMYEATGGSRTWNMETARQGLKNAERAYANLAGMVGAGAGVAMTAISGESSSMAMGAMLGAGLGRGAVEKTAKEAEKIPGAVKGAAKTAKAAKNVPKNYKKGYEKERNRQNREAYLEDTELRSNVEDGIRKIKKAYSAGVVSEAVVKKQNRNVNRRTPDTGKDGQEMKMGKTETGGGESDGRE